VSIVTFRQEGPSTCRQLSALAGPRAYLGTRPGDLLGEIGAVLKVIELRLVKAAAAAHWSVLEGRAHSLTARQCGPPQIGRLKVTDALIAGRPGAPAQYLGGHLGHAAP
jgi:hypothetical protein